MRISFELHTFQIGYLGGLIHRGENVQLSQHTMDRARRTMGPPDTVHLPMAMSAHPYSGNHLTVLLSLRSLDALTTAGRHSTSPRTLSHPGSSWNEVVTL